MQRCDVEVFVDDGLVCNEVFARSYLEDAEDGQVDVKGLGVKTHLIDHDVLHIGDVLH